MSNKSRNQLQPKALLTLSYQGKRPCQEDFVLADQDKGIFVVADGFGGPVAGKNAAQTGAEAVKSFLYREAGDLEATLPFVLRNYYSLVGNVLFNALIHANRKVLQQNKNKNVHEKGGASVISGFIDGDLLAIANVGVCTGWLFRKDQRAQLTIPRSLSQLVNPFYTHSEVNGSHSVPLTALGITEDLEPEIFEYRVMPGDWLLFQTDGVPHDFHEKVLKIKSQNLGTEGSIKNMKESGYLQERSDNASFLLAIF